MMMYDVREWNLFGRAASNDDGTCREEGKTGEKKIGKTGEKTTLLCATGGFKLSNDDSFLEKLWLDR